MGWSQTMIAIGQVAVILLVIRVTVHFVVMVHRKYDGLTREILECERGKSYRQGVAHGWKTREKWSRDRVSSLPEKPVRFHSE